MKEYRLKVKTLWIWTAQAILQPDPMAALAPVPLLHFDTARGLWIFPISHNWEMGSWPCVQRSLT